MLLPFISSEPMFNNATFASSLLNKDLCNADPIKLKSTKFFSLHSILAPRSRTTFIPFLLGHRAERAGLSIFSIIFKLSFAITNNAPVFPAETIASDTLFFKLSIDSHMLVSLPFFAAVSGLSSSLI